jgi:ubiquinone/menaquinone biosynthesis C-methylase UbiE
MHILDLACGQGFFSEHLSTNAHVTGVDISPELIAKAKTKVPKATFVVSPADKLTFIKDKSIDHVLISLAIQNIARADAVFSEVARVLKIGGMFTMVLNHPAFRIPKRSSWQYDAENQIQYRRIDAYLSESREEIAMHPGVANSPTTVSFHRPLQWYTKHLAKQGLLIERIEEWTSHRTSVGARAKAENTARKEFPLFLTLRTINLPRGFASGL